MIKWLSVPESTKKNAYTQIAEKRGMTAFAVEKDWWVVQTLSIIFEMEDAKYIIFKGGTSLSKAWNLIHRFSEDIDLAIDRAFLGFAGELNKNQRENLRKAASKYTSEVFLRKLEAKFEEKGIKGIRFNLVEAIDSAQDPRIIEIYYPNVIEIPGYLQPRVQVEIGCRSLREPCTIQSIASLVDEEYAGKDFAQAGINIPTVNPERTFLEKIFLLHEEFQRPPEKMRVDRLSRHLYDVYKLSKTVFADKALNDPQLYGTIVDHRHKFTRIGGVNYNLHQPQTINFIPPAEIILNWRADYNTMIEQMIYETNPSNFDEMIMELTQLKERINAFTWKFETQYPNK